MFIKKGLVTKLVIITSTFNLFEFNNKVLFLDISFELVPQL